MVAYSKPQQWKKEERESLSGEGDKIKIIILRFEREQVFGFSKGIKREITRITLFWDE